MEDICVVERKDLSDLVHSLTVERSVFVSRLRLMAQVPHRLLIIDAALSQVKSRYAHSGADPNRITNRSLPHWPARECRSSAQKPTSWARKL